jgi:hypothetical protein
MAMQRCRRFFASPRSRINRVRDQFGDVDCSRMRTVCGQFTSTTVACSRTIEAAACARTWIVRGHDCWRGLNTDADCLRTRTVPVRVLSPAESNPWTGQCHVRDRLILRGYSACLPRLIRGHQVLRLRRGRACLVLNMMRNTLPFLLQQLVAPVLQLCGDGFNTGGLFNRTHFDASCVVSA